MVHNELWKILEEMGIPEHLTCLLRNLHAGRKQQLELDIEQQTGFKSGKSAVVTGLEKVSFHPDPKERQCQRMLKLPHNCTHLTR